LRRPAPDNLLTGAGRLGKATISVQYPASSAPPIRVTHQEVAAKPSRPPYFCYAALRENRVNSARRRFVSPCRSTAYRQTTRPPGFSHAPQSWLTTTHVSPLFFSKASARATRRHCRWG